MRAVRGGNEHTVWHSGVAFKRDKQQTHLECSSAVSEMLRRAPAASFSQLVAVNLKSSRRRFGSLLMVRLRLRSNGGTLLFRLVHVCELN